MPTDIPSDARRDALRAQRHETLLVWQIAVIAFILLGMLISLDVGAVPTEFPDISIAPWP